jgi:hypothetical protein
LNSGPSPTRGGVAPVGSAICASVPRGRRGFPKSALATSPQRIRATTANATPPADPSAKTVSITSFQSHTHRASTALAVHAGEQSSHRCCSSSISKASWRPRTRPFPWQCDSAVQATSADRSRALRRPKRDGPLPSASRMQRRAGRRGFGARASAVQHTAWGRTAGGPQVDMASQALHLR